jgi:hypothetical protein
MLDAFFSGSHIHEQFSLFHPAVLVQESVASDSGPEISTPLAGGPSLQQEPEVTRVRLTHMNPTLGTLHCCPKKSEIENATQGFCAICQRAVITDGKADCLTCQLCSRDFHIWCMRPRPSLAHHEDHSFFKCPWCLVHRQEGKASDRGLADLLTTMRAIHTGGLALLPARKQNIA